MLHKNVTAGDNHVAYNWTYANAAARTGATGFVTADVGKLAWQTDNNTFWLLTATTPSWAQMSGSTPTAIADITDWPSAVSATEVGYLDGVTSSIQTQLGGKQASLGFTPENSANKGQTNGYASLDGTGKVPSAQLPSYVDDVLEYANLAAFPGTGTSGILYVAIDTGYVYRWSGSAYIQITGGSGVTNLSYTAATRVLASDTGSDATLPLVSSTDAGLAPASGGGTTNFLRADSTWAAPPGGGGALDDLTDVVITAATNGQVLKFNGTNWVNGTDNNTGGSGGSESAHPFLLMGC